MTRPFALPLTLLIDLMAVSWATATQAAGKLPERAICRRPCFRLYVGD
jgi:hypothetical protein